MDVLKKVLTQTSWQVVGKIIATICAMLILSLLARNQHYSATGVAIFTLASTYLTFFNIAADLGLNGFVLPYLANDSKLANKIFNLRIYWGLVLVILANVLLQFMPFKSPQLALATLIGSPLILSTSIYSTSNLIFQSKLRYDLSIIASSLEAIAEVVLIFLLTLQLVPTGFILIGTTTASIINNIFCLVLIKPFYRFKLTQLNLSFIHQTMKEAWPITVTLFMNLLYFRADTFILSSIQPLTEVAIYNFAYQFFSTALVLPTYIMNGFYPIMIETFKESKSRFFAQIKLGLSILFFISVIGVFATYLLAPWLIDLIGGDNFHPSIQALNILSISFPAFFLTSLLLWVLVILKRYYVVVFVYSASLLINVILNLIFIPQFSYLASSWITAISEYLILILQLFFVYKYLKL